MRTTDGIVYIHHEADWSSKALVSWCDRNGQREASVDAVLLWGDNPENQPIDLPPHVTIRAVRLATRGRAQWEQDLVLSRPVHGRAILPWSELRDDDKRHDPHDAWLFDHSLATRDIPPYSQMRRRPIPLGWVENVAIAMLNNGKFAESTAVLIDIGAPHRAPCTCGRRFHDHGCPQADVFPRIGRLAINLSRVDKFIDTLQAARSSTERIFVPEAVEAVT